MLKQLLVIVEYDEKIIVARHYWSIFRYRL
ncbi:hypothetical protein CZ809_01282 [Photobacterium piscicola]|uniref:Uncharacterized protein n=1 Tax=Photobacterium piscicola TaxID=1378299 RepID=A0A1T5HYF4_9GAMM|nr:hypothetical protein CZ809_01282 [Photobacterium piscicola]